MFGVSFTWAQSTAVEATGNSLSAMATLSSLSEVVVTANRMDTPVSQVPNSLTVITGEELQNKQSDTVRDALANVPGLDIVRTGGPGEITSTFIRGGSDDSTLVMIDGIPLDDPISAPRSYDFLDQLSLDGVGRIEVVRGPQSVLYGSNAMAGVVNIVTTQGAGPSGGSVLFEGGSYGTFHESAQAQGGDSKGNYSLSTSYFNTAGFPSAEEAYGNSLNNPDSDFSGLLKVGASLLPHLTGDLLVRFNQSRTNIDDGAGSNTPPDPVMDDPGNWVDQEQTLVAGKASLDLGDWRQSLTLSFSDNDQAYSDSQNPNDPFSTSAFSTFDGQIMQATWQNDLKLCPQESLVFGLQGYREWGSETSLYSGTVYPPIAASQWEESGFLQSQTKLEDRFFLDLGGRVDDYSSYGVHGTYQGGLAYILPGLDTKLKANYGTGFEAPSLYQLFSPPPYQGNPDLQPETNTGWDAGFEQPLGNKQVAVGADYFNENFGNLIVFQSTSSTSGIYENSASFQTQGVEAYLSAKVAKVLTLKGSYTYTDVETGIPASQSTSPLLRKPANMAGLDVDFQSGAVEAGVSASYVGARPDFNFYAPPPDYTYVGAVTLPEYFLVNLHASYEVDSHVKLFARVDNLFNEFYEEIYGYTTPRLSAYGGTKISF